MNLNSVSDSPWYMLNNEVLQPIFLYYKDQSGLGLKSLLPLREVNKQFKAHVEALAAHLLKVSVDDKPSAEYLSQFRAGSVSLYRDSKSKKFLELFLYAQDCNKKFERYQDVGDDLEILKTNYHNPCLRFDTSLALLDQYRKYWKDRQVAFKPRALSFIFSKGREPGYYKHRFVKDMQAYYGKLQPLLTEDLQELQLDMHSEEAFYITLNIPPRKARERLAVIYGNAEPLKIRDYIRLEEGLREQNPVLTKELYDAGRCSALEKLLFKKVLNQLSSFALLLDYRGTNKRIRLDASDAEALQQFMPNLRCLTLRDCVLKECFIKAIAKSAWIAQLESLCLNCSLPDEECLGILLGANLSHLKDLDFGDNLIQLDKEGDPKFKTAIDQLGSNFTLENLESLAFLGPNLFRTTVAAFLKALRNNTSLQKLRTIKKDTIGIQNCQEHFPRDTLVELQKCEHLKNFDFGCIAHLFKY